MSDQTSTDSNEAQTETTSVATENQTTAYLKTRFADNESPTGNDFANLIDASFNKMDGPIRYPVDEGIEVATKTNFTDLVSAADLSVDGNISVGESYLNAEALKVGDTLDVAADQLTLSKATHIDAKATLTGAATITKEATNEDAALTVEGGVKADAMQINEGVVIGESDAQLQIECAEGDDAIRVKKDDVTQFSLDDKGQLSLGLSGEQSTAKLHIRHHEGDSDTLLRIDNRANDETPIAVTSDGNMGLGTASPFNALDVSGSVSVGQSALVSPENSLSVHNRLGVGTASPMARLDIHSLGGEEAVTVRDGDNKLLAINREGVTTDVDLSVHGMATLADAQVSNTLSVSGVTTLEGEAVMTSSAEVKGALIAKADTQVETLTAHENAKFEKVLVVEGDTKHAGSIGVGLGIGENHNPQASLHIREGDTQPGFKIENKIGESQLFVNSGQVLVGNNGAGPVALEVYGETALHGAAHVDQSLFVGGSAELKNGLAVEKSLRLHSAQSVEGPAVEVISEGSNDALHIKHVEETVAHTLIVAKADKVGVHTDSPQAGLHVAGDSLFDEAATFKDSMMIEGELSARADLKITGKLGVNRPEESLAQVHIGHDEEQASFRVDSKMQTAPALSILGNKVGLGTEAPEHQLDVKGDVKISGVLNVNDVLSASESAVKIAQQSSDSALIISKLDEDEKVVIHHNKIGVNVESPTASLHVEGDSRLNGVTNAQAVKVSQTLAVTGVSTLGLTDVSGSLKINSPQESNNTDLHVRQSQQGHTALRVDRPESGEPSLAVMSGQVGINTLVPTAALDVKGDVKVSQALAVEGKMTANDKAVFNEHSHFSKSAAFSVESPNARVHIAEDKMDSIAFQADYISSDKPTSLVVRQGKLGIGTLTPKAPLDVRGDSELAGELKVFGTTYLDNYLNVAQDAVFDSDLVVKEKAKLKDQTIIGRTESIDPELMPNAQLYIADTNFKEALRIDSADYPSLIFADGKLGLGNATPRTTLDVVGEARISGKTSLSSDLYVEGDGIVYNNLEGHGKLDISQKATFGSDVLIRGDLYIEDKTDIEEELSVVGATELKDTLDVAGNTVLAEKLSVAGHVTLMNTLDLTGLATFKAGLNVAGHIDTSAGISFTQSLSSGVDLPRALQHFNVLDDKDALLFEKTNSNGSKQSLLSLSNNGFMAIGKATAEAKLDVQGEARISDGLKANSLLSNTSITGSDLMARTSIQLANGPKITGFSTDNRMGGDYSANELVPTQAAVKAYIDNVVVPFGQGGKTYTVSSQVDFDDLFNRGEGTIIDSNTTVLLLPLGNQDFNTTAYQLKNTVRIRSGVSIVGFNESSTRIIKSNANCRFELIGSAGAPIENVAFDGFTFDGANLATARSGAALYLEHVQRCQFNCRFENHITWADGGAIYGAMSGGNYTVSHIEARNIYYCQAVTQSGGTSIDRSEGGAAYGLDRSVIHAYFCKAEYGGGVSLCRASQVVAEGCSASLKGGAAYRCLQLRMNAVDCSVDEYNGQGGGAYFCSDLICEGQWINNVAAEGPHIYASNNLTGSQRESHYWKGDYVGRRIDDGTSVWHHNNE